MKKKSFIALVLTLLSFQCVIAQQPSVIGHQDLVGYFNPALLKGEKGKLTYMYRYQWEGLGPAANTLLFEYPLRATKKAFALHSLGTVFQYEDLDIMNQARFEVFTSSTLANFEQFHIGIGLNAGLEYLGLNTSGFNVEELVDPELANLDRRFDLSTKPGLAISHKVFELGFAARLLNLQEFAGYHSSLSLSLPIPRSKFHLSPMAVMHVSQDFDYQGEVQLKTTYQNKVSLTTGYRQDFGAVFQLAFRLNKAAKISYGVETPKKEISSFGLSHEFLGTYGFDSPALAQHRKDSLVKARRDAINRARVERFRALEEKEIAILDSLAKEEENGVDLGLDELVDMDRELRKDTSEIAYSIEELSEDLSDYTHLILDHIGFEVGLYLLRPESYDEIDKLYNYLRHHKTIHIEIQGHTDNLGTQEENLLLSQRRALAVYNYLVSRGVDPARMNVVGYGENLPLFPNDTEAHKAMNRRIEIVLIKTE